MRRRLAEFVTISVTDAEVAGGRVAEDAPLLTFGGMVAGAELLWVSKAMTRVALDASYDLPEWTPAAVAPSPTGMVLWAEDLPRMLTAPFLTGRKHSVPAVGAVWDITGGQLHLWVLCRAQDFENGALSPHLSAMGPLLPLSEIRPRPALEVIRAEMMTGDAAGLVALLGATWILMQQVAVAEPRTVTGAGGSGRSWTPQQRKVIFVDLRRPAEQHVDRDPQQPGRLYSHRWLVRGHWRQQAVGTGHTQRRPTWVPSYIKGPAGAPLVDREHVHVWRR